MGTKTLTITEEAYDRLRAHKRADESFTDTILRITDPDRDPMAGFGVMADVDGFREAVEGTRDRLDDDLRKRNERGRRGPKRNRHEKRRREEIDGNEGQQGQDER